MTRGAPTSFTTADARSSGWRSVSAAAIAQVWAARYRSANRNTSSSVVRVIRTPFLDGWSSFPSARDRGIQGETSGTSDAAAALWVTPSEAVQVCDQRCERPADPFHGDL